tara:strand:- start:2157 stop:4406 length:2250 start_codon:yes stop_codon:yes gene_type:complete
VLVFTVFLSHFTFGKKSHNQLLVELSSASFYEDKVNLYFEIIKGSVEQKKSDSAFHYIEQLVGYHVENEFELRKEIESKIIYFKAQMLLHEGRYHKSQNLIKKSLEISNQDTLNGYRFFNLAVSNKKLGNYSKSAEYYIKSIKYFQDSEKHLYAKTSILINLANVLYKTGQSNKALDYLSEALKLAEIHKLSLKKTIYTAMGNIFQEMGDYEVALDQFEESYQLACDEQSTEGRFYSLINMADVKRLLGDEKDALSNLQSSILLLDTLKDRSFKIMAYMSLGDFFAHVKNKKEAEFYLGKSLILSDSSKSNLDKRDIFKSYKILYEKIGDFKKSLQFFKKFQEMNDIITSDEMKLKVSKLNSEFELEMKESELRDLATEKELKEFQYNLDREKRENRFNFLVVVGVLLLIIILALVTIGIIRAKKNKVLKEKNEELFEKKNEIEIQNQELEKVNVKLGLSNNDLMIKNKKIESQKEELQVQRDLLRATHDQLKVRNKDVTDSIHYAQKIQQAMLNSSFHIEGSGVEHFTFYKPRNIVSGDFYWSNIVNNELIVAIADCTGHGVPGAFMSCLGISLLNEIVFGREIVQPHKILEELRESIIQLIATDKKAELQIGDGMDMAVLCLDLKTNVMRFSGAMNGLVVVSGQELEEIKGDKTPIGQHIVANHKFTMIEKQLKSGDSIYATTDGYKDQFGGPKGKKMGKRKLHEKLLLISNLSVQAQKSEMIAFYKSWRKYEDQVDDVCLFGMRLN